MNPSHLWSGGSWRFLRDAQMRNPARTAAGCRISRQPQHVPSEKSPKQTARQLSVLDFLCSTRRRNTRGQSRTKDCSLVPFASVSATNFRRIRSSLRGDRDPKFTCAAKRTMPVVTNSGRADLRPAQYPGSRLADTSRGWRQPSCHPRGKPDLRSNPRPLSGRLWRRPLHALSGPIRRRGFQRRRADLARRRTDTVVSRGGGIVDVGSENLGID